jgi:hypothetical protein
LNKPFPYLNKPQLTNLIQLISLALLILLSLSCAAGGTTIGWTDNGAPIVRSKTSRNSIKFASSSFPLLDNRGILHKYKACPLITRPTHMTVQQVYCGSHYKWETLRIVWRRDKLLTQVWKWTYIVR